MSPRAGGAGLAALLLARAALAAPAAAEAQPGPPAGIEQIEVLGVRTGVLRRDPSVSGERVDFAEVEAEQKSVADLLSGLAGVQVRRFGGAGERAELSIRGSTSAQVALLLDGVRLDSLRSGSVDLSTLPAELFGSLELQRGGGAHAGSGAIGGVVALRPRELGAEPRAGLRLAGGSFGTWEGSAHRAERIGDLDLALGYAGFHSDGNYEFQRPVFEIGGTTTSFSPPSARRINNESERHAALAIARRALGPELALRWLDYATYLSRGEPGLDSGAGAQAGQRSAAHLRSLRNVAQLALEAGSERGLSGQLRAYHRYERAEFRDPIPILATAEPIEVRSDDASLGAAGELELRRAGARAWRGLAGGVEARLESYAGSDRPAEQRSVAAGWLRGEFGWPGSERVRLLPGLRLDATEGSGLHWLPGLGLVLEPAAWLRLRARGERSFRAPSFDELYFPDQGFARGNPALRAERAEVADAGIELAFLALGPLRDVELAAQVFHHEIEDSIAWFLVSPTALQPRNTGRARERGVELRASFGLTQWLALSANATWLDAEFAASGIALPGRAPLEISARALLGDPERWKLGVELQHTGRISVSEGGSQRLPARSTSDAFVAFNLASLAPLEARFARAGRAGARVWASLRGRNLADIAVRDALFFPQPGRSLCIALEADF